MQKKQKSKRKSVIDSPPSGEKHITVETRSTIGLQDITAIEYECTNCHSKTLRLLDDKHNIPMRCGNCPSLWFAENSSEHRDLQLLVSVLRDFPRSSVNAHVAIKLEIRDLPKISGRASSEKD